MHWCHILCCYLQISHDDDIIPGWEGQIVVWIEEDSSV